MLQARSNRVKYAVIIGAGPAGLTAAYELLTRTDIVPIVLEKSNEIGGLSRTVNYKGNRIDVGGHRFFSKSQRVISWWQQILPLQASTRQITQIAYRGQSSVVCAADNTLLPEEEDRVMLIRDRRSRIYFKGQLFDYPLSMSGDTLRKLGLLKSIRIGLSYLRCRISRASSEANLEEFLINRFGRELYLTFFKTYTEKVWGVSPRDMSAEWGVQRIKGLSLRKMAAHGLRRSFAPRRKDIDQRGIETSLIERFMYPKLGPGQMWEEVARRITSMGGKVMLLWNVSRIDHLDSQRVTEIHAVHSRTGESQTFEADYVFSTMPVNELVSAMKPVAPAPIREVAAGLRYREFITVGVLCKRVALRDKSGQGAKDNWIYIQEPGVRAGRLQVFNNWSPAMVADPSTVWIGVEYFCNDTDELWRAGDNDIIQLAQKELITMQIVNSSDILDATVIRAPKAYPAYFGTYNRFAEISSWSDRFENLFLIGRNGMHRYNNQDHSMLTAMVAVDNIIDGVSSRENLWALNTEQEYQEEKRVPVASVA